MSTGAIVDCNSHSSEDSTAVKMANKRVLVVIFLSSAVNVIYGFSFEEIRAKRELGEPTDEDCSRPPMMGLGHACCRVPKERIWGDIKSSIHKCLKKFKPGHKPMNQEMAEDGEEQAVTSMDGAKESPWTTPQPSDPSQGHHGRPFKKPHHHPHHQNDSCFMECVFEDQGFLMNTVVNKLALIGRLNRTLEKNQQWHKIAVTAVEVCSQMEVKVDTNTTCQSGSEEIFRCIFKYLFFNCPNWSQTEYCTSLKKFYEKCPNGPPPEMSDSHPTSMPEETEAFSTTEPESDTAK